MKQKKPGGNALFIKKRLRITSDAISLYYSLKRFNIGIMYRPDFYQFGANNKFTYQHVISLDLVWKIRLKTAKNK